MRPLLAVAANNEVTARLIGDASRRQVQCVIAEPYANAFNPEPSGRGWTSDFNDQCPWVWEGKYELDSLTTFLDLALRRLPMPVSRAAAINRSMASSMPRRQNLGLTVRSRLYRAKYRRARAV